MMESFDLSEWLEVTSAQDRTEVMTEELLMESTCHHGRAAVAGVLDSTPDLGNNGAIESEIFVPFESSDWSEWFDVDEVTSAQDRTEVMTEELLMELTSRQAKAAVAGVLDRTPDLANQGDTESEMFAPCLTLSAQDILEDVNMDITMSSGNRRDGDSPMRNPCLTLVSHGDDDGVDNAATVMDSDWDNGGKMLKPRLDLIGPQTNVGDVKVGSAKHGDHSQSSKYHRDDNQGQERNPKRKPTPSSFAVNKGTQAKRLAVISTTKYPESGVTIEKVFVSGSKSKKPQVRIHLTQKSLDLLGNHIWINKSTPPYNADGSDRIIVRLGGRCSVPDDETSKH